MEENRISESKRIFKIDGIQITGLYPEEVSGFQFKPFPGYYSDEEKKKVHNKITTITEDSDKFDDILVWQVTKPTREEEMGDPFNLILEQLITTVTQETGMDSSNTEEAILTEWAQKMTPLSPANVLRRFYLRQLVYLPIDRAEDVDWTPRIGLVRYLIKMDRANCLHNMMGKKGLKGEAPKGMWWIGKKQIHLSPCMDDQCYTINRRFQEIPGVGDLLQTEMPEWWVEA
jgi:hypothetical protein